MHPVEGPIRNSNTPRVRYSTLAPHSLKSTAQSASKSTHLIGTEPVGFLVRLDGKPIVQQEPVIALLSVAVVYLRPCHDRPQCRDREPLALVVIGPFGFPRPAVNSTGIGHVIHNHPGLGNNAVPPHRSIPSHRSLTGREQREGSPKTMTGNADNPTHASFLLDENSSSCYRSFSRQESRTAQQRITTNVPPNGYLDRLLARALFAQGSLDTSGNRAHR